MEHNKFEQAVNDALTYIEDCKSMYDDDRDAWHNIDEYIAYENIRIIILESLGDLKYEPPQQSKRKLLREGNCPASRKPWLKRSKGMGI